MLNAANNATTTTKPAKVENTPTIRSKAVVAVVTSVVTLVLIAVGTDIVPSVTRAEKIPTKINIMIAIIKPIPDNIKIEELFFTAVTSAFPLKPIC